MLVKESDNVRALRDQVARFASRELAPLEDKWETDPNHGRRVLRLLGENGYLGLNISEVYGGAGLSHLEAAICTEEMAKVSPDAGAFMAAASLGQAYYVYAFGSEEQKRKYLPDICAGKYSVAIGITEPEAGTASTAMKTRIRTDGEDLVITGGKHYVSNVPNSDLFVVYGRMSDAKGAKSIGAVLVDRGAPGFSIPRMSVNMAGHRQAELLFEECRIPASSLLMGEGAYSTLTDCYNLERCGGTSWILGTAIGAFDKALEYVQQRRQFNKELIEFQAVQMKLSEMAISIEAARLMLYESLKSSGEFPERLDASMVKVFGNETARRVADLAIQLFGGAGYLTETGIERRYRIIRGFSIAGGTLDIHHTMIAGWLSGRRFSQWAAAS